MNKYFEQLCLTITTHKAALTLCGRLSDEGLEKSEEEQKEMAHNLEEHDWSKYCMPLYFAGNVFDPDLGTCLAGAFDQGSRDPMLEAFFNCTVFHNILEGSTKDGHHQSSTTRSPL